jgi:hypothetical protein
MGMRIFLLVLLLAFTPTAKSKKPEASTKAAKPEVTAPKDKMKVNPFAGPPSDLKHIKKSKKKGPKSNPF